MTTTTDRARTPRPQRGHRASGVIAGAAAVLFGVACSSTPSAERASTPDGDPPAGVVEAGATEAMFTNTDAAEVFQAARDTLLDAGFRIDRFDARAGVLTTHPVRTAGLATPWITPRTDLDQAGFDLITPTERRARVRVTETGEGRVGVELTVTLHRIHRPGLRLETESIRLSRVTTDPRHFARGMAPESIETLERDDRVAADLLEAIRDRLGVVNERAVASSTNAD